MIDNSSANYYKFGSSRLETKNNDDTPYKKSLELTLP